MTSSKIKVKKKLQRNILFNTYYVTDHKYYHYDLDVGELLRFHFEQKWFGVFISGCHNNDTEPTLP